MLKDWGLGIADCGLRIGDVGLRMWYGGCWNSDCEFRLPDGDSWQGLRMA